MLEVQEKFFIQPYALELKKDWDKVLDQSSNGTFMHRREYMEYHSERFHDASLLIYQDANPISIFPAEEEEQKIYSHRGLSFAGWILQDGLDSFQIEALVKNTLAYYKASNCTLSLLRSIPGFYVRDSQAVLHKAMVQNHLVKKFSFQHHVVSLPFKLKNKGKKWGSNKAKKAGVQVRQLIDFHPFWENLLIPNLALRHQTGPAHSIEEIRYLKNLFPDNIQGYGVYLKDELLGGAVLFVHERVVHLQYIAAMDKGRKFKCLDYLMLYLIEEAFPDKFYFSLGHSHEPGTGRVNEGLAAWKKSLGGEVMEVHEWTTGL